MFWKFIKDDATPLRDPGRANPLIHLVVASPWSGVSIWRSYVVYPQP